MLRSTRSELPRLRPRPHALTPASTSTSPLTARRPTPAGCPSPARPSESTSSAASPRADADDRRIEERGLVEKLYNPTIKAWFGDKGDGVHTGEPSDPRIAVFEVKVDEIRHFHQQKTSVGTVVDIVSSAISGSTATPGEIRTITGQEIASAWAAGNLKEP